VEAVVSARGQGRKTIEGLKFRVKASVKVKLPDPKREEILTRIKEGVRGKKKSCGGEGKLSR